MPRNQLQPEEDNLPPDPPEPEILEDEEEVFEEEEAPEIEEPEAPETEIERQARLLGWHPKEEYFGPPHRWKSAEEFMRQGQNVLPILRDNNKRLLERAERTDEEIKGLKKTISDQTTILNELRQRAKTADERGYQRALSELKTQQREAAASGDVESFDKVSEQIEETIKARATVEEPPPKDEPPPKPQVRQEVVDFVNSNPWYNNDPELARRMNAEHEYILRTEPDLDLADNLAKAAQRVKQAFPAKFPRPNGANGARRPAAPVAQPSGARAPAGGRAKSGFDAIEDPTERAQAKESFARYKRQWPDYTEEEYLSLYNNPKADVLAVQRAMKEARRGK